MDQQDAPHFPVSHAAMPANKFYRAHHFQFSETFQYFADQDGIYHYNVPQNNFDPTRWIKITTIPLNHPNGCLGYKIEYMGKSIVYCTDNEPLLFLNKEINKHAKNCDWLLLDGQYTQEQLSGMSQTFGHGTPRNCVDQAIGCNAKKLIIHHHDPRHDDTKLLSMELDAIGYSKKMEYDGSVEFAREGTCWEV